MKVIHSPRITRDEEIKNLQLENCAKGVHNSIMELAKHFPKTNKEKREEEIIEYVLKNTPSY